MTDNPNAEKPTINVTTIDALHLLSRGFKNDDIYFVSATRKSDGQPTLLVCTVLEKGGLAIPLAELILSDPRERYDSPNWTISEP